MACSRGHCCYQFDGFVIDSERVDVELTLLTRIREVLGSNLGRIIGYSDRYFPIFPQPLQACPGIVSQLDHGHNQCDNKTHCNDTLEARRT